MGGFFLKLTENKQTKTDNTRHKNGWYPFHLAILLQPSTHSVSLLVNLQTLHPVVEAIAMVFSV